MKINHRFLAMLICFTFAIICNNYSVCYGAETELVEDSTRTSMPVSFGASTKYLWGESKEYVYDPGTGDKISQLDWELDDIVMVGGIASIDFVDWLQFNIGGWVAVTENSGSMVDRDWVSEKSSDWSFYSKSPNELDHGYMADANFSFPVEITRSIKISPIMGFKFDNWKWQAEGGKYIYSSQNGWRDLSGTFPDVVGIRYEQWFYAPYLGMNIMGKYKNFFLNTYIKGTLWAWSKGKDEHLLRNLVFEDKVYNQSFIGAGLEVGYNVSHWCFITLGFDYQDFMTAKGSTRVTDTRTGNTFHVDGDAAGIGHHSSSINFAVGLKF